MLTDESMIHQIIFDLVDNAVKYTEPDSTIQIEGRVEGPSAIISIRDEGGGIPGDLHDKIFDRFYQVDQSSTRQVGGTGLGLYICRSSWELSAAICGWRVGARGLSVRLARSVAAHQGVGAPQTRGKSSALRGRGRSGSRQLAAAPPQCNPRRCLFHDPSAAINTGPTPPARPSTAASA